MVTTLNTWLFLHIAFLTASQRVAEYITPRPIQSNSNNLASMKTLHAQCHQQAFSVQQPRRQWLHGNRDAGTYRAQQPVLLTGQHSCTIQCHAYSRFSQSGMHFWSTRVVHGGRTIITHTLALINTYNQGMPANVGARPCLTM